ncbi:hypothetical protein FB451DRAFT_1404580 [Mycena latifolia]|nr:hypothetical protein FB451DRAFT_1404580 [Mycena latifolia]
MPVLALAYGSFGDILATVQLAIRIAIILRRSGTPSSECAETEKELKLLGGDLDLAHLTLQRMSASSLSPFVDKRIREKASLCHAVMARFFAKLPAQQSLWQNIRWAVSEVKDLAALRMQLIERRTALGLLVEILNSVAMLAVAERVETVGGQISLGSTQIQDVQAGVSGLARQLSHYQEQIIALVNHVPHGVSETIFVVITPTGGSIPIALAYCKTFNDVPRIFKTYLHGTKDADRILMDTPTMLWS